MDRALLPVRGVPGSPYTRKMLALLRYRRIPYRFLQSDKDSDEALPAPKVGLIPVVYFPDESGALTAEVDSTPIIRRLELEYPGRSVIPPDPVVAFLNYLLEDYGDEWLTKAMFHYRWYHDADRDMAGSVLPHYADVTQADGRIAAMTKIFSERQTGRLYVVGSNDTTAGVIEESYRRFLQCLNGHLQTWPFIMGGRPGSADFACFGQLTQLAQFDPTPSQIAARDFPRVHAWVSKMEDHSGLEVRADGFMTADAAPGALRPLLGEIGRTYAPVMLANAKALERGEPRVEARVGGAAWVQQPFAYQAKCLQWLRIEYARLAEEERQAVQGILAGTGCEALLQPAQGGR